ncbi:hypothetical protein IWX49DRAFT_291479 [Phyllosticta citricarpa]|uniref:Uncharacterized protein n=2 Tax=Phyllosticta TaxID=121621 RepID=A0ABR1MJQ7_9PEZI
MSLFLPSIIDISAYQHTISHFICVRILCTSTSIFVFPSISDQPAIRAILKRQVIVRGRAYRDERKRKNMQEKGGAKQRVVISEKQQEAVQSFVKQQQQRRRQKQSRKGGMRDLEPKVRVPATALVQCRAKATPARPSPRPPRGEKWKRKKRKRRVPDMFKFTGESYLRGVNAQSKHARRIETCIFFRKHQTKKVPRVTKEQPVSNNTNRGMGQ